MPESRCSDTFVAPIGVQLATARLQLNDRLPQCCPWRCNLTALSQHVNLYFVACAAEIHVHVPQFPAQTIDGDSRGGHGPALILTSPQTDPSRTRGHIDPRQPHAINTLLVRDLGTEEIVLAARDDGDVDAFWVRHVVQAIERRRPGVLDDAAPLGPKADELRPFFSRNVGASAWGLAVHSAARVLAASCNRHEISIWRFGLERDGEDSDIDLDHASSDTDENNERMGDVEHTIVNGAANIPCIAFCNTGDDPGARWLLTTDIHGRCRVIDTHAPAVVQSFDFCPPAPRPQSYDSFDDAGWLVAFLDRRAFQPVPDCEAAVGCNAFTRDRDSGAVPIIWDISSNMNGLRASRGLYRSVRSNRDTAGRRAVSNSRPHADESFSPQDADDGAGNNSASDGEDSDEDEAGGVSLLDQDDTDESRRPEDAMDEGVVDRGLSYGAFHHDGSGHNEIAEEEDQYIDNDDVGDNNLANDDLNEGDIAGEDETLDDDDDGYDESELRELHRLAKPNFSNANALFEDLPCPILHASKRNIYMLQPSDQSRNRGPFRPPLLKLFSPLRPRMHFLPDLLDYHERLNMFAEITPLGVLVVASQAGQALVLSLNTTTLPGPVDHPVHGRKIYAMRAETILPTAEQEQHNERPPVPLLGIAASPLQGCDGRSQRWRLLLYYLDHSVLAYEIRRKAETDDSLDIERLVT